MKRLINKLINKAKEFLKWVWHECKDWRTLVLLGVVCLVLGFPVWGDIFWDFCSIGRGLFGSPPLRGAFGCFPARRTLPFAFP